jgi:hypothetical protein
MPKPTYEELVEALRALLSDVDFQSKAEKDARRLLRWHNWAAQMAKTHRQRKCPTCGFYSVWVPK